MIKNGEAKLVTAALIVKDNKILLIERANEPELGKWALPGGIGGLKKYKKPIDAVQEEVKYDLGVEFYPDRLFNYYYRYQADGAVVTLVFLGTINDKPKINPEAVNNYKYIEHKEMFDLVLAFDHFQIIKEFFNKK